jgi:NAD-dependent dihydropyrimidine dehydrogenase PreA subunit
MPEATYSGVPRNKIPWHPIIDYEKCDLCGGDPKCIKFCAHFLFEVVEKQGKKKLIVKNPNACPVFCVGCEKACPIPGALKFPSKKEVQDLIEKLRKER